jgi:hypothetical protein
MMMVPVHLPPPSYGGGGPKGRGGKTAFAILRGRLWPPPPRKTGHLPRFAGEER